MALIALISSKKNYPLKGRHYGRLGWQGLFGGGAGRKLGRGPRLKGWGKKKKKHAGALRGGLGNPHGRPKGVPLGPPGQIRADKR